MPTLFRTAQNLDEAYHACHPETPLEPNDGRYVDLTPVRGGQNLAEVITRRIRRTPPPASHKQLLTGHRGCGKSTELKQLQAKLEAENFFVVYFDVESVLDLGDLNYLDVLLAMARAVSEAASDAKLNIPQVLLKNLDKWFAERILSQEKMRDVEGTLKAEFAVEPTVPLLTRFLLACTGQIRSGSTRKLEIRQTLERELRVFIERLNELVDAVQVRLQKKGRNSLVLIVDGLEKMHYKILSEGQSSHSHLFAEHAEQLKAPHCHIIYTVPISLLFNLNLGDAFAETDVIPMVKISEPDGVTPCTAGREALQQVISKRVEIASIFTNASIVMQLIEASGGSVRDLLRLVRFACDESDTKINAGQAESAILRLAREYDRLVKDDDLSLLADISRARRVSGNEAAGRFLHHRIVLEYVNGERWADVHPAVRLSPRVKKVLHP
ncbi:AAA family ATPase [candidate division KSB1 bacterium]|nr:AAA family ATPase [candidate division KSB1 bacterium]